MMTKLNRFPILPRLRNLSIYKSSTIALISLALLLSLTFNGFTQDSDIDFNLDVTGKTKTTPYLLQKLGIDLSGRGFHNEPTWPQNLAASEAIAELSKYLDLQGGIFRLQFNLWEFVQLAKNKQMQIKLLENYSTLIKNINEAGGRVLMVLYGMPPGLGKVLDKKSSPWDIKAFKELIKSVIRYLSCQRGFDIWYEVWNAPDLDDFFLGQKREYLNIYKAVAESVKELETETNRNIFLGGPGVTWWFQNLEGNTIFYPERSLIYELIRFCSQRRLPLDFISWHAYSSDPFVESEITRYKKIAPELIRDWFSYFGLDSTTPLVISEWNYDTGLNFEPKRGWESYVAASFIPSRIRNMLKTGIDYQIFFCLEDFKDNKQGVNQNVGLFWFEPEYTQYTGGPKSMFNVIRMLNMLGSEMFQASLLDNEPVGIIATKTKTGFALLLFYYIDPEISKDYLSRNITELHPKLARSLANLINSNEWEKIKNLEIPLGSLRLNKRIRAKIEEAIALNEKAKSLINRPRNINLHLTKLQENYTYKKYIVDKSCRLDCAFKPCEEKEIEEVTTYKETLALEPYSVVLIVLDKKSPVSEELDKDIEERLPIESEEKEIKQLEEEQIEEVIDKSQQKGAEQQ